MIVLGIETSCDETACAIVDGNKLLSNIIYTQTEHSEFGGVVPELASREHIKRILPVIKKALDEANLSLDNIQGIGAVRGPGLLGSLLVGYLLGKSIAWSRNIPFYGVNHIEAHLFSAFDLSDNPFPAIGAVISGGHTHLWYIPKLGDYKLLGKTRDDAAGEALDKGAKILGLGYPGGPIIDKLAKDGNPNFFHFPRPLTGKGYDFSFSGLKTSLVYYVKEMEPERVKSHLADIASSYQQAIVDVIYEKILRALIQTKSTNLIIGGGVSANSLLRKYFEQLNQKGYNVYLPQKRLSTDNGVMVARCARYHLVQGERTEWTIPPEPYIDLEKDMS